MIILTFKEFKEDFNAPPIHRIHLECENREYLESIKNANIFNSNFVSFSDIFLILYFSVITGILVLLSIILHWGFGGILPIVLFNLLGYIPLDFLLYYKQVYIPYKNSQNLLKEMYGKNDEDIQSKIDVVSFEVCRNKYKEEITSKLLSILDHLKKSKLSISRKAHYLNIYIKEIISVIELDKTANKYTEEILKQLDKISFCLEEEENNDDYKEASIKAGLKTIESLLAKDGGDFFE